MDERLEHLLSIYIPMSEQSFLLLLNLLTPKHGYAIMQIVSEQSDGRITLSPSTVYTILYKMEQDGVIKVKSEFERRKIYEITNLGISILKAENERLQNLVEFANNMMNSPSHIY